MTTLARQQVAQYTNVLSRYNKDPSTSILTAAQIRLMVDRFSVVRKASPPPVFPDPKQMAKYEQMIKRRVVNPLFRNLRSGLNEAQSIRQAHAALNNIVLPATSLPLIEQEVDQYFKALDKTNNQEMYRSFRDALGVDIRQELAIVDTTATLNQFRRENIDLIRTIPSTLHQDLYERMTATFAEKPFSRAAMGKLVREQYGASGYNARRLARDQTSKATGQFNKVRQTGVGIEQYKWRTSQDNRVRPSHAAHEGKLFDWENPPAGTGHPGTDVNCRCSGQPEVPEALVAKWPKAKPKPKPKLVSPKPKPKPKKPVKPKTPPKPDTDKPVTVQPAVRQPGHQIPSKPKPKPAPAGTTPKIKPQTGKEARKAILDDPDVKKARRQLEALQRQRKALDDQREKMINVINNPKSTITAWRKAKSGLADMHQKLGRMSDRQAIMTKQYSALGQKMRKRYIEHDGPKASLNGYYDLGSRTANEAAEEVVDDLKRMFTKFHESEKHKLTFVQQSSISRSNYGSFDLGVGQINMSKAAATNKKTMAHEVGHAWDNISKANLTKASNHWKQRTKNDRWSTMRDLTGNQGYNVYEESKPNAFFHPYVGLRKSKGVITGSEITSMGLQEMYQNPVGLAIQDSRLFDFMFDVVLRGK